MFAPTWRKAEENGLARHDRAQRALSAAARDRKLEITRAGRFFHLTGGSDKGVPILRVARLAVDLTARGQGLGSALLRLTIELAERMMADFGCVGLVVDAKSESESFYRRYGFVPLHALEGTAAQRPEPTPMFLALGSVPPKR